LEVKDQDQHAQCQSTADPHFVTFDKAYVGTIQTWFMVHQQSDLLYWNTLSSDSILICF